LWGLFNGRTAPHDHPRFARSNPILCDFSVNRVSGANAAFTTRISARARQGKRAGATVRHKRDLRDRRSGTFLARVTTAMAGLFRFGAGGP